ncbi:MAG TPA: SulP family inorganic anion transporter [Candidatus Polarisedimenticolia bacterium]|nr:SulP family inorganic anion transporter [Candidatus Polarisedimenticolia bacterium]
MIMNLRVTPSPEAERMQSNPQQAGDGGWLHLFQAIRPVTRAGTVRDAFAGFQLAAMNIPQALGYTKIAGMPAVAGFYTLLLPLLAFAVFGSSRYLVVAADSATASILAGKLGTMAPIASARYVALASTVALLTAGFLLLARVLKLGFLADFLSQTVLTGFLTGVGFQVGIAVLSEMVGLEVHSNRTVEQLLEVSRSLPRIHLPTVAISAVVVTGVFAFSRFAPKVPGSLLAVAGAIAASATWDFAGHGIAIIGPVVGGLPHLGLPDMHWKDVVSLLGVSVSCFVMILAQSAATARFYAGRHHQELDESVDLVGLSAANAAAALSGTFVVDGSPTQTAMVERSGGRSQLAQVATAITVAFVLLFLTNPLQYLPRCVLGAIVSLIAVRLIDLRGLRDIRRESPGEFVLAVFTAAVVVLVGVEQGILLAMVLSLLRIVRHSYRPHTGVFVVNEGDIWQVVPAVPGAVTKPRLVIYRFGAALFYANASLFAEQIRGLVGPTPSPVRWMVVDAEAITNVDYTAARAARELHQELADRGVVLVFARVPASLKADLDRHLLTEVIGSAQFFDRLHDAVAAFAKLKGPEARTY